MIYFTRSSQDKNGDNPDVPYRETPHNIAANIELGLAHNRNTVAECYNKILKDIIDAEALLAPKSARIGATAIARITKEAAIAYKTRVYLYLRDWNIVITEGVKLSGRYVITMFLFLIILQIRKLFFLLITERPTIQKPMMH